MTTSIPLDKLLGSAFIGIVLSTILYGVSCLQTYLYYMQYCKNDSLWVKLFVALAVTLDSTHVALIATTYYYYTMTPSYGDTFALDQGTWSIVVQICSGGLIIIVVQLFFAWRLYMLGKRSLVIPGIICFLGAVELGCSIAYTIVAFEDRYLYVSGVLGHAEAYTSTAFTANIICDLLIAGTTVYHLQPGRAAFSRTNKAVNLIMAYALSTCILALVFSVICLITFALSTSLVYATMYSILVRIYPCSFLSTLNSRDNIRRAFDAEITCPGLQSMVLHSDNHDKDLGSSGEDLSALSNQSGHYLPEKH
ncbi:hypothetical protein C8Q72DRAFT_297017 [Fomitopsis betulina]|nr:hypothetical protein C8Q72DRAFT_297017 [Fomitopsis betulina]